MTAEQQTTPEQRAALRQRYTPEPVPKCGTCKKRMVQCYDFWNSASDATYIVYRCPLNHSSYDARKGDSEILAAVADADALVGALATVGRFRDSLAFYRTEAERYRAALCFYADPHLYADHFEHDPVDYERVSSVDIDGGAIARAALDPTDATSDRTTEGAPS